MGATQTIQDATHFRKRAAHAREMAQSGDDIRLSRMLLEVALDLDAEAEAMESGTIATRRGLSQRRPLPFHGALLHATGQNADPQPVHIINLSGSGARLRTDDAPPPGSKVILELTSHGVRVEGTILRRRGAEAAMAFEPSSCDDPALSRLLRSEAEADQNWAPLPQNRSATEF